jgi:pyruvate dehydrogenase E2 component (dihydrolipoamide acetyltransferase)
MHIIMPKLGLTMTEGTLTKWHKAEGDTFEQGEILFEFESEKSALEFEAPVTGVLTEILVAAGQTAPCGIPVCIVNPITHSDGNQPAEAAASSIHQQAQTLTPPPSSTLAAFRKDGQRRYPATPRAKARANELQLDLVDIQGSGPEERIQLIDVERFWASQTSISTPASEGGDLIPLSPMRQVIAQRLSQSAFTAPHVTLFAEADATNLVEARAQLNTELPPDQKIAYNTLLAAICARALREQPHFNAVFDQAAQAIRLLPEINIALAVETERGLTTPVLARVDTLSLVAIQRGYAALIERALAGQSLPADLAGGTFTLTNLGAFEIEGFTPIINPPQIAILGVGHIKAKAVAHHNEVAIRQILTLSLSFDHRANDGAPAAQFLQRIKQLVERPFALML